MLVLSRRPGEKLILTVGAVEIVVACLGREGGQYRIGVQAPRHVKILREELVDEEREGRGA